jgi:hypothetical protein
LQESCPYRTGYDVGILSKNKNLTLKAGKWAHAEDNKPNRLWNKDLREGRELNWHKVP